MRTYKEIVKNYILILVKADEDGIMDGPVFHQD